MEEYQEIIRSVLAEGEYKSTRTGVDTISSFMYSYSLDLSNGFPLVTTKQMGETRWNSIIHELLWFLSGKEHIRDLTEKTGIWDEWANEDLTLPTSYGRFWRRYPIPEEDARVSGEWWPNGDADWVEHAAEYYDVTIDEIVESFSRWTTMENGSMVFDQIKYVIDTLRGDHPYRSPESRRLIINAWHPANAAVSKLPPCHYTFAFNVQGNQLNLHLTQRSADTALGVPFNIASYSLLAKIIAKESGLELGKFAHTLIDAHIYCGNNSRSDWYENNLDDLQTKIKNVEYPEEYNEIKRWINNKAPESEGDEYDHIPKLLTQLTRTPKQRPKVNISDKSIDELTRSDFQLQNYDSHPPIKFSLVE